ncbi:MAG: phosphate ABC transporter permease PstA [Armatimonadota bacterium]
MALLASRRSARWWKEWGFLALSLFFVSLALVVLTALVVDILMDGLQRLSWDFLTTFPSRRASQAGIKSALVGSIYLMLLTGLISAPLGVGAAIYLEEYAPVNRWTRLIELNIANLAGVPSVVYGLLGLEIFVRMLALERSLLAGALTMSLLILPVIIIASREALRAIPSSIRFGARALGATRWQSIYRHVLPLALPGILTGVILGFSRAIGETAPLITIGALTFIAFLPENVFSPFTVLPIQAFNWISRPQEAFHQNAAAAIIVLLVLLAILNSLAIWLRIRFQKRLV